MIAASVSAAEARSKARLPVSISRSRQPKAKIVGYLNVAGRLAASASALYSKNLLTFVDTLIDKKEKKLAVNWDDEIVKGTLLTRDGSIVHPNFMPRA